MQASTFTPRVENSGKVSLVTLTLSTKQFKKIAKDKRSSLFCGSVINEEKKSFIKLRLGQAVADQEQEKAAR